MGQVPKPEFKDLSKLNVVDQVLFSQTASQAPLPSRRFEEPYMTAAERRRLARLTIPRRTGRQSREE